MIRRTRWVGDYGYRQSRTRNDRDYQCALDWEQSDTPESRAERNRLLRSWAAPENACATKQPDPVVRVKSTEKRRQAATGEGFLRFRRLFDWQKQALTGETNEVDIPGDLAGRSAS